MYTIKPKERYAKSFGRDLGISTKAAAKICRVIRKKPLSRTKRLLNDLIARRRSLGGKYYTKTVKEIADLLSSCEKNAAFLGLDNEKLFVHASAHTGTIMRRRRRKAAFGSRLKRTNLEIMLIEKGKEIEKKEIKKKPEKKEKPAAEEKKERKEKPPAVEEKEKKTVKEKKAKEEKEPPTLVEKK